ncbi:MAG: alpha-L-fucosidase [Verrucomicrobiota bacterium]|jgi:alpha-L-fucosidase
MKTKIDCLLLVTLLAWLIAVGVQAAELPVTSGPFQPTMESLTNYSCPEWFRDAKFGIWAHWGPQAVPMEGDWYARKMYQQGSPDYKDHLARYGHPSTNGWKDIIPLWKAERWEPEKLMALYKKAGARYFVSMGTHHDDFFLWNSQLHKWNAVNYGPQRDVVADWQKAAKKQGLPFGVSEHLGASFTWFQDSHKSDHTGPFAGVPYDGANSNYWDLYHFPAEPGDVAWYSKNPRWQQQWFNEIKELVDNYHPDLLYSDGGVPFGNEVGLSLIADLYNDSVQHNHAKFMAFYNGLPPRLRDHYELERRSDKLTAVYNCKQPSDGRWVQDFERGVNGGINPYPWQTDTSIGDWFYNRHWKYQPLSWTVHMLVDITSKNGNLLLNVVLRPDGSLDPEVETMLHQMADWTAVNGEAIYGTRPWLIFGEGLVLAKGGAFKENFQYTAKDIRFTMKGRTLYAIALGWPDDGKVVIKSLARTDDSSVNKIKRVGLLGYKGKLKFTQTAEGLTVELPAQKLSDLTCSLKITGSNLKPVTPSVTAQVIYPDSKGDVFLSATNAELHGSQIQLETQGGLPDIGHWDKGDEWVSWTAQIPKAGTFNVSATVATPNAEAGFVVEVGSEILSAQAPMTGSWDKFQTVDIGQFQIIQPGELVVKVRAKDKATWKALNLNSVKLTLTGPVLPAAVPLPH